MTGAILTNIVADGASFEGVIGLTASGRKYLQSRGAKGLWLKRDGKNSKSGYEKRFAPLCAEDFEIMVPIVDGLCSASSRDLRARKTVFLRL